MYESIRPTPSHEHLQPSQLHGIWVPTLTPFTKGHYGRPEVHLRSQANIIRHAIINGAHGIFLTSNIGGGRVMTPDQWLISVMNGVNTVRSCEKRYRMDGGKTIPVVAGVLRADDKEMVHLAELAEQIGVDGLVVSPYYGVTKEGGDPHAMYRTNLVLMHTDLPVILYNNPDFQPDSGEESGMQMSAEFVKWATELHKIIGIKDTSRDPDFFKQLLQLQSDKFRVLQGDTLGGLEALQNGAAGMVSAEANIDPLKLVQLYGSKTPEVMAEVATLAKELFGPGVNFRHEAIARLGLRGVLASGVDIYGANR